MTRKSTREKFEEKVDVRGLNDCWPWTGSVDSKGYGKLWAENEKGVKKCVRASRLAWQLYCGKIPKGKGVHGTCVLHDCPKGDNPLCVNPFHLKLGSNQDNVTDMVIKGRGRFHFKINPPRGDKNFNTIYTPDNVRVMRKLKRLGLWEKSIGSLFGIQQGAVHAIVSGKTWNYLEAA